jgi:1,4-dihydroxy-2-naphthoate octaprenyltransferase
MSARLAVWLLAIRPQTLTAAVAPVLVGSALAAHDGRFRFAPAASALAGALLIQIGTNLFNDVADFERGADTAARTGPVRVTQRGLLPAAQVRRAAYAAFALAALAGAYLVACAGWPILVLGAGAIAAGIGYTGGARPLGYRGLGDVCVFAFFGVAAVAGTYFVQARTVSAAAWLASIPIGALATAILVVNNLRDLDTDRAAGKRTLAVRLGARATRIEYAALLALAFLTVPALCFTLGRTAWGFLPWLTLPWAAVLAGEIFTGPDGVALNRLLVRTARLQAAFAAALALGLVLGSTSP